MEKVYYPDFLIRTNGDYLGIETYLRLKDNNGIWRDCHFLRQMFVSNEEDEVYWENELKRLIHRDIYFHSILFIIPNVGELLDSDGNDMCPISDIQIEESERLKKMLGVI